MGRIVGMITANPAVLLWIALASFIFGVSSGAGGAWWIQGLRLTALHAEYDSFVAKTKAQGEAAQKLAIVQADIDKHNKEASDHEYEITIASLTANVKRLRDARASSSYLPAPSATSNRPNVACFDRDKLESAIRNFDTRIQGLVDQGSDSTLKLKVAQEWGEAYKSTDISRNSPANNSP